MKKGKMHLNLLIAVILSSIFFSMIFININASKTLKTSSTVWTTTEVVSTQSTDSSAVSAVAVDKSGNVHVVWQDYTDYGGSGTDLDIFYKSWISTSKSWTTTEVVSTESTGLSENAVIVVDLYGNVHVVWDDNTDYDSSGTDYDVFYKYLNSTTHTWTTTEVVSTECSSFSWYPTIAVDKSRNIHVAWGDFTDYGGSGTDGDIFYKRWNSTTKSWTTAEVVSTESIDHSVMTEIAVDVYENAHVVWEDYTDYGGAGTDHDIFYKRWNSTTNLWTTTEVVSTESTLDSDKPSIAMNSSGNVYVVWEDETDYSGAGSDSDIFFKYWNSTSNLWTTTEVVSTESTSGSFRSKIIQSTSGNIYVVWEDLTSYLSAGSDKDIFFKQWNIDTRSWTTTDVVSTESTGVSQYPEICIDKYDKTHVVWHDNTNYDESGTDNDIFYKKYHTISNGGDGDDNDDSGSDIGSISGYNLCILMGAIFIISIFTFRKRLK